MIIIQEYNYYTIIQLLYKNIIIIQESNILYFERHWNATTQQANNAIALLPLLSHGCHIVDVRRNLHRVQIHRLDSKLHFDRNLLQTQN